MFPNSAHGKDVHTAGLFKGSGNRSTNGPLSGTYTLRTTQGGAYLSQGPGLRIKTENFGENTPDPAEPGRCAQLRGVYLFYARYFHKK